VLAKFRPLVYRRPITQDKSWQRAVLVNIPKNHEEAGMSRFVSLSGILAPADGRPSDSSPRGTSDAADADNSQFTQKSNNKFKRGAVTLLTVVLALAVRRALSPFLGTSLPYITLFPAIAFAAWYSGAILGGFAVVAALVGAHSWFVAPSQPLHVVNAPDLVGVIVFLLASAAIVALGEANRRQMECSRNALEKLDDRVQQRTAELNRANQSLRELSARLLQLQDEERRRIARELHDSVGQMLAALAMNLSVVRTDIERLAKTAGTLDESVGLVQEMNKEVRTISHLLHPPLLDEAGLESAIRWYIDGFAQRSSVEVRLDLPRDFERLSRDLETAIFRTVQECLTNIHRHSESPTADVRIVRRDGNVCVEVEDKGKGISPEKLGQLAAAGTPGVGIRGMRERIRQIGGTLEIHSRGEGSGTIVTARLPVGGGSSIAAA
jgi:signal transduction histidine kinase